MYEMEVWLNLHAKGGSLAPFFREYGIGGIAIYGCGTLGGYLYDVATSCGVEVVCGLDRAAEEFCGVPVFRPSELGSIDLRADLIVVCVSDSGEMFYEKEIAKCLRGAPCPAVYLIEIVDACFFKQIVVPHCLSLGAVPYLLSFPLHRKLRDKDAFETAVSAINAGMDFLAFNPPHFSKIYASVPEYGDEYIKNVFSAPPVIRRNGALLHSDIRSPYMNVSQGLRFTHGAPEAFGAAVHLIGNCLVFGVGLDDSRTVASCLQRELNAMGSAFRVLNHGVWGIEPFDFISYRERMLFLRPNPGDVVVFIVHMMFDAYFERMFNDARRVFSHLSDCFNRPRGDGALFFDYAHPSPHGAERIARHLRDMLAEDGIAARGPATACVHAVARAVRESSEARAFGDSAGAARLAPHGDTLAAYVSDLKSRRRDAAVSGAVVVNCNPFTKGHRYLIETAANTVDVLYVFVVEEDKSEIAFDDRIRMVEIGTEDIENAAVLPSGKFILSALTFPEYFLKDALQEVRIDASADVLAFAKHVAPALGVTKRFVGREPFDAVTRQYNQTLKDVLPRYGIEVVEFPRREFKGTPISASAVRRLLKARDFRGVSDLIPESTLGFLKDLFVT